jgi:O-antigen ligase
MPSLELWESIQPVKTEPSPRRAQRLDALSLGLALCAVPISIAVTESFLAIAVLARIIAIARGRAKVFLPRVFWFWSVWVAFEIASWLHSPEIRLGLGEIRHLLLLGALFLTLPAIDRAEERVMVWRGVFLTATVGSASLIVAFIARMIRYRREIAMTSDPSFYLRTGGLLHHWMVYATVEILVFGAMLEYWHFYPEHRRWILPMLAINCLAIVLSLTRMLWLCCLLLTGVHLLRVRTKWIWGLPVLPLLVFNLGPRCVKSRITETFQPAYYSNAERLQMLRAGWAMVVERPLTGIGAGRVEKLYTRYLSQGESAPAYHGHLHNNILQLTAQFGLPVIAAAALFLTILIKDIRRACRCASDREARFLSRASLAGVTGFLIAGLVEYTYGHSLGLILLGFASLSPFMPDPSDRVSRKHRSETGTLIGTAGSNVYNCGRNFFPTSFSTIHSRAAISLFLPELLDVGEHCLDLVVRQLVLERRHLPFAALD